MREIYTARLARKTLLSAVAQCYHFEFAFDGAAPAAIQPGQFLSMLAEDAAGKTYTRAYSIASAPYITAAGEPGFDLCVNRVEGGFFSNLLCDMREGETLRCHGPHGLFTLRQSAWSATLLIAAGTGIAPMRGFVQSLFAGADPGRSVWLVYEAPQVDEFFYGGYFHDLESRYTNFHYLPVHGGAGDHDELELEIARITAEGVRSASAAVDGDRQTRSAEPAGLVDGFAYACGLSEFVKVARARLFALGWQKSQVLFERYD